MVKKTFATIALAVLAVLAVPAAANAAGYVPADDVVVSGTIEAGATVSVAFTDGAFTPGESVSFAVTGSGTATLSAVKAATVSLTKSATSAGAASVNVALPADATGTYTTTATGLTSGTVGTAAITLPTADAGAGASSTDGGLASTGYDAPMLAIWAAAGALLLGVALMVALTVVRRQRANA